MKNTYLVNRKIGWQHSDLDDYLEAFSKLRLDVLGSTLLSGGDYLHLQQNLPQGKFIMIKYLRSCDPPKHWKEAVCVLTRKYIRIIQRAPISQITPRLCAHKI